MRLGLCGIVLGVGGILSIPSTRAADLPPPPPVVPAFVDLEWSGFYLGMQLGTVASGARSRSIASGDRGLVVAPGFGGRGGRTGNAVGSIDGRDLFTGLHIGYNQQARSVVYGIEGDVDSIGPIQDLIGSARGRLGLTTSQFLFYGTAGVGFLSVGKRTDGIFVGGNGGNGGNGSDAGLAGDGGAGGNGFGSLQISHRGTDGIGFVGGGGAEMRISPRVTAGIEALYYIFDGTDVRTGLSRNILTVRGRMSVYPDAVGTVQKSNSSVSWAGGYAGVSLGGLYDLGRHIDGVALADGEAGTSGVRGVDGGGGGGGAVAFASFRRNTALLGGGHAGYNWQSSDLVYGGEADLGLSSQDAFSVLGTIRARLGVSTFGSLLYGTGGLALDRDRGVNGIFAGNGGNGGSGTASAVVGGEGGAGGVAVASRNGRTRVGFAVGGGLETHISERTSAGLEALYYDFGDRAAPTLPSGGRSFAPGGTLDAFVLRARLSMSFTP